jgi:hypothetical protein
MVAVRPPCRGKFTSQAPIPKAMQISTHAGFINTGFFNTGFF